MDKYESACPHCGLRLNVPIEPRRLRCPSSKGGCGRWWSHPAKIAVVPMQCAKKRQRYVCEMLQAEPGETFQFVRTAPVDPAADESAGDARYVHEDADRYSWQGWVCPGCGHSGKLGPAWMQCGRCGELSCLGASYRIEHNPNPGQPPWMLVCGCGNKSPSANFAKQIRMPHMFNGRSSGK